MNNSINRQSGFREVKQMGHRPKKNIFSLACLALLATLVTASGGTRAYAAPAAAGTGGTMASYCVVPPFIGMSAPPLVMLMLEKDEKLFHRAYNDFSDLDSDGQMETTYKHSVDYYGYFDSYKCYRYTSFSATNGRFDPVEVTADKYCTAVNSWSGNFLNWATMTRIDAVRKALYGGKRVFDSATVSPYTVLQRAYLPQDSHSFVKIYACDPNNMAACDIKKLTPYDTHPSDPTKKVSVLSICNTTLGSETANPMMRVAAGDDNIYIRSQYAPFSKKLGWERWASNEKWQCALKGEHAGVGDEALRPGASDHLGDLFVHVVACNASYIGRERCKLYDQHQNYKPIGLLQEYGEDTSMYFGLVTGSYTKNKSGGVLRQKLGDVGDENSGEVNRATGVFTGQGGIIPTIDALKIRNYSYANGNYDTSDNCPKGRPWFNDGWCTSWGNPLAEMYYEALRVFAGKRGSTAAYYPGSETSPNLPKESWNNTSNNDPYTYSEECAEAFILTLSDAFPSYDSDQVPGSAFASFTGDLTDLDVSAIAGNITTTEGVNGNFFIGNVLGGTQNNYCSVKSVTDLGRVRGLCPTEGGTQGSYYLPAVAWYGQTTDLRPDADPDPAIARIGNQNVTSYSVAFGDFAPYLDLDVNGKTVRLLPYCYNNTVGRPCGLMNFWYAWSKDYSPAYDVKYDIYYAVWDDAQQGSDYDSDVEQQIWVQTKPSDPNYIFLYTAAVKITSDEKMDVGITVSGTTDDAPFLPIRVNNLCFAADATQDWTLGNPCMYGRQYTATGDYVRLLKSPLWYASKYGGFTDLDGDGMPNLPSEWDRDNNGVPDTYFSISNPLEMEAKLVEAFTSILNRVTSGTAASVLASGEGSGANLVQAVYYPKRRFFLSEVKWIGGLHNYWYYVDPFFNNSSIREDTIPQDRILNLTSDLIVHMFFDQNDMKTKSALYQDTDADGDADNYAGIKEFGEVDAIWKAGYYLWARDLTLDPRTIYYHDPDTADPLQNFSVANRGRLSQLMNIADRSGDGSNLIETEDIIRYTHGEHVVADRDSDSALDYRSRVAGIDLNNDGDVFDTVIMDYDSDGDTAPVKESSTWKLGDIVDSTPRIASSVRLNYYYDRYLDETYREFYETASYRNRGMVYAGANDGMLHAFKLGVIEHLQSYDQIARITGTDLGREQWAFIPYNALPYLQYMADPDYCHVNTVDLSPLLLDASIEVDNTVDGGQPSLCGSDSANCVKGAGSWRTILIGGMRFGGACRPYGNTDSNAVSAPGTAPDGSSLGYSSYFAMDVTDENDPELLWEFTHPALGFSTSGASIVKINGVKEVGASTTPDETTNGHWFAVFASGPTGPINQKEHQFMGRSDQTLKLFIVDLKSGNLVRTIDTGIAEAFSSSILSTTLDTDSDYSDNALYIGYTRKDPDVSPKPTWTKGGVGRLLTKQSSNPNDWVWSVMVDGIGAVSAASSKTYNVVTGHQWVFTATGRYFYKLAGELDDATTVQGLYGFLDPCYDWAGEEYRDACKNADPGDDSTVAVSLAGLLDVTSNASADVNTVLTSGGWKIALDPAALSTGYGAERVVTDIVVSDEGYVYFTTFQPYSGSCVLGGRSYIWVVKYNTGGAPQNIKGRALVQVSTGAIEEVNLSDALTEKDGRRTVSMEGVPPTAQGLALLSSPPPMKKVLHIRER